jgi:endonuclease/exonuclease/phosphatase family metal-dependent hydrolase
MDAGTDLNLIFAFLPDVPRGVSATLEQINSTDIPGRAARLADEIRTSQPDLIGLQEATEWRSGTCGSTTVLYDQLQLLLDALKARNMHYTKVAVQVFPTIEAPTLVAGQCLSFTDRNAVLAKTELRPTGMEISNIQMQQYQHYLDLSALGLPPIYHGFLSCDIRAGSESFRFYSTHLESTYAFDPNGQLQSAQGGELLNIVNNSTLPTVLSGDFNSNAETGPEQTPTVGMILAAGFTDVWRQFNPPGTGFTWPLYCEDGATCSPVPNERIDLIFTCNIRPLKAVQTGLAAPWASDHSGVAAMLQIGK